MAIVQLLLKLSSKVRLSGCYLPFLWLSWLTNYFLLDVESFSIELDTLKVYFTITVCNSIDDLATEAAKCGRLNVGDQIVAIGDVNIEGMSYMEANKCLRSSPKGPLKIAFKKRLWLWLLFSGLSEGNVRTNKSVVIERIFCSF